jgi:Type I phosphodiesterase / nucleotide pyrophosphatase
MRRYVAAVILFMLPAGGASAIGREGERATRNVILITADGLRWQEVFRGAEEALISEKAGGVRDVAKLRERFMRPTADERRRVLMPFFWSVVAREGRIYGNRDKGSQARVSNGKNFSYPGYNELLTGSADPRIDSNDKRPNPNVSVLEWLSKQQGFSGKVAMFGSWDVFPYILAKERSGLTINAGWEPISRETLTARQLTLNSEIRGRKRRWEGCRDDDITFDAALEDLMLEKPRVLYIALGDTDEHGHEGHYDELLDAVHGFDKNLERLWTQLAAMPDYRGATTLVLTTDHGRGDPPTGWRDHGAKVPGSDAIWLAILGPDSPPLGEVRDSEPIIQAQVAATVAALLGLDYKSDVPKAAPPLKIR